MGRGNVSRKDFAIGKGASIYSRAVLGNRRGGDWEGRGGLQERFVQRIRQTNNSKNVDQEREAAELQSLQVDFLIALVYCRLKDK